MKNLSNPYSRMLLSATPDFFFGRHADIETILHGISSAQSSSFSIQGIRMIGKTTLLKYLSDPNAALHHYPSAFLDYGPNQRGELIFQYIDFYDRQGHQVIDSLFAALLNNQRIRNLLPSLDELENNSHDVARLKSAIVDVQTRLLAKGARLIICLDHFGKAFSSMEYDTDLFLRSLTPDSSLIIATEKSLSELRIDILTSSPLVTILTPRLIGLLFKKEAKDLISSPLKKTGVDFTEQEVDYILQIAGYHPYLLTLVCEFWFNLHLRYLEDKKSFFDADLQERMKFQLASLPAILELFRLIWSHLDADEQNVLSEVARGLESEDKFILNKLAHKSLVVANFTTGQYSLFAEVFRILVLQQHPTLSQDNDKYIRDLPELDKNLLLYLTERPGQLCTFDELLKNVWGDTATSKRALEAAVYRLRVRFQDTAGRDWDYIQNVRGKGYIYKPKTT